MSDQTSLLKKQHVSKPEVTSVLVKNRQQFLGFLAKRLGNMDDAEDVLQDFSIRVLSRQEQLKNKESMTAWLYSVLRSTLVDHYRKTGRQGRIKQAYKLQVDAIDDPFANDESFARFCSCLHGLLPHLRPDQAKLLQLLDVADGDRKTIATELGISVGSLAVRLHRARKALRQALLASCTGCLQNGFDDCP